MKVGKPKSKRVPVRLRHKIEKASAAKQRKQRRFAKKNPEWRTKLKKDPGVPRLWPYREKLLNEIEEQRRLKKEEEEEKRRKGNGQQQLVEEDEEMEIDEDLDEDEQELDDMEDDLDVPEGGDDSNPMAALLASAKARAAEFNGHVEDSMLDEEDDEEDEEDAVVETTKRENSRKQFNKIFNTVLAQSDIVLYVLDARDPEGTRSRDIEQQILTSSEGRKRLVFILNKIDLIPPAALKGWISYLRRSFPTIPLRAAGPAGGAKTFEHRGLSVKNTSEALFKTLKSFAESKKLKRSVVVGVVGFPNVGKSSVINTLAMRTGGQMKGACKVGAEAGVTTGVKEIKVDGSLKIVDCPGIVFPSKEKKLSKEEEKARLVLLNAIPHKEIDDPITAVKMLLKRLSSSDALMQQLYELYDLKPLMETSDGVLNDFLVQVARRRGRLGRGGVPNMHAAAEAVLTDWRDGRIQGWVDAPAKSDDQKVVVREWADEFRLDGLWGESDLPADMEE